MDIENFWKWLKEVKNYNDTTCNSRITNCKTVCYYEGDLDTIIQNNLYSELLLKLEYSAEDERKKVLPKHNIPINGNIRKGTATYKQAVKLYYEFRTQFKHDIGIYQPKNNVIATSKKIINKIDSYDEFLRYFNISKEDFYLFGLSQTVFAPVDIAIKQWHTIKYSLLNNKELFIRGYGRNASNSYLFIELYGYLFNNTNIKIDKTNNNAPRRNLKEALSHTNTEYINFQRSHIIGATKNPLLFEAVWNICYTPKMYDPLTGHEAKNNWPIEYQKLLFNEVMIRYRECIVDYNSFLIENDIREKIMNFYKVIEKKYGEEDIVKFKKDVLKEWDIITL